MPWCDSCSRYHAPTALADKLCPVCGGDVTLAEADERTVGESAPWHFWIVVVALAGYLIWRVIDAIRWVIG